MEYIFDDQLIGDLIFLGGFQCIWGTSVMLSTMGAEDFLDFVFSYFIELFIMIADRIYITDLED